MADHFSLIGVRAGSAEALSSLVSDLSVKGGETLPCPPGAYQRLSTSSGAELWVHMQKVDGDGENGSTVIAGITPFFHGEGRMPVRVRALRQRPGDNAFEGAFYVELGPTIALVDVVDFARVARTSTPFMALAQIAAFPQDLNVFPTKESFDAAQEGKDVKFTQRSFLASGLFQHNAQGEVVFMDPDEPGFDAPSRAFFTGEVLKAERRQNPWTSQYFFTALVATAGGTVDLVSDEAGLNHPLTSGVICARRILALRAAGLTAPCIGVSFGVYGRVSKGRTMRTNIDIDDALIEEVMKMANVKTKKDAVDLALREFLKAKKKKDLFELAGKVEFDRGYDYKTARQSSHDFD